MLVEKVALEEKKGGVHHQYSKVESKGMDE
jgi:hypothetical protein